VGAPKALAPRKSRTPRESREPHTFRVWAPAAERVEVVGDIWRQDMERQDGGWWESSVAKVGPGSLYAFVVDGGPPRPDPRSAFQPDGVHGPSQIVDHGAFAWRDEQWRGVPLTGALLYELHVGTFTPAGTFDAVVGRLGHLVELGIDAIELLPVAEFPGRRGWGYDGADLFAPHRAYGGPNGLKRLVDACHEVGIGVVMDVVYSHFGPSGNYLLEFGPYLARGHATSWGDAVNFDGPDSLEVRAFVIDNALMWLRDYHCDGLRLDAVHAILDDSAVHVLEQLALEVDALAAHLGRSLSLIAESDRNDPRYVRSRDAGGFGLDAAWADEWHHAVHATLTGDSSGYYEEFGPLPLLAKALGQAWVYDGTWSPHRRRQHGRPPEGMSGPQFVVYTQNHDQVGNGARGERTTAAADIGRLRIAAALLLTGPFTPMLFQGEEWAATTPFQYFTDIDGDPAGGFTEGRREEFATFGWDPADLPDPQDPRTFKGSKLNWGELSHHPHDEMLAWYRELIALRRLTPALSDPRLESVEATCDEEAGLVIVRRGSVMVVASLAKEDVHVDVPAASRLLAASAPAVRLAGDVVVLPPDTVAILESSEAEQGSELTSVR
jgi:maltooligosyltrehalose trehalohydrolase